ncbi:hypothetical protein ACS5PN_23680 [Roseateles sp. NT4]|uniref:hypothetical protein n=1 Tax=Roseateles sp. NT4 TaxID=3453715 RepID=UPI003EE9B68B
MDNLGPAGQQQASNSKRDQVNVNLMGLGPQLRAYAARNGITFAEALRTALARALQADAGDAANEPGLAAEDANGGETVRVLLRLQPALAATLASRACASGVSRSRYVTLLMDGAAPPPLPQDHGAMVAALMASTDGIATLSVDLNAFMRLIGQVPSARLDPLLDRMRGLVQEVRAHLIAASTLLQALDGCRKAR